MATPKFDALRTKLRSWINKPEVSTISDSVLGDCLSYAASDCYRELRIPAFEETVVYVVSAEDNVGDYTTFDIPENLTEFVYVQLVNEERLSTVINHVVDNRTFLDPWAEKYSRYNFTWRGKKILIEPKQEVGQEIQIHYYRYLAPLGTSYSVSAVNYVLALNDADQFFLTLSDIVEGQPLYFAGAGADLRVFDLNIDAIAYGATQPITTVTTKYYIGQEASNWLVDEQELLLLMGAGMYTGIYLVDDAMTAKYNKVFTERIALISKEEKFRRARGGNVRMNINANGLI
jgi:hypothetical protein